MSFFQFLRKIGGLHAMQDGLNNHTHQAKRYSPPQLNRYWPYLRFKQSDGFPLRYYPSYRVGSLM